MNSLYDVLGVTSSATPDEIKQAYRRLASASHPDKHPDSPEMATTFHKIVEAYRVLSDADKRAKYDSWTALPSTVMDLRSYADTEASAERWMPRTAAAPHQGDDILIVSSVPKGTLAGSTHRVLYTDHNGERKAVMVTASTTEPIVVSKLGQPGKNGGSPGDLLVVLFEKE